MKIVEHLITNVYVKILTKYIKVQINISNKAPRISMYYRLQLKVNVGNVILKDYIKLN